MKDIKEYEGLYAVDEYGNVWSYKNEKYLAIVKDRYGYLKVCLNKNGEKKQKFVHRLVGEAYIPNPEGLETIDHIDGDKTNNYVGNLQWMTRGDNIRKSQGIAVICVETGWVFQNMQAAADWAGVSKSAISKAVQRKGISGGYHWERSEK